jgi:hypothetical protein
MDGMRRRRVVAGTLGAALGVLGATGVLAATSRAVVGGGSATPPRVEATHLPPLLTLPGEAVTLRYDIYCVGAEAPTAACDADGVVYARAGDAGPFEALPLRLDPAAVEGRYFARIPDALVRSGFSYYALLRDRTSGASTTLPPSAPEALERSVPIGAAATVVRLGRHTFGSLRVADARVASARWGDGSDDVGLEEQGPDATPIGASSFDVDASGRVTVLDEAHRRLLRWAPNASPRPERIQVAVRGTIGDLSSGSDGNTYVVEAAAGASPALLRSFAADGHQVSAVEVGQDADAVRGGPDGPIVLEPQSGRWFGPGQPAGAGVGRPVGDGLRVVVYRPDPGELRLALVTSSGTVARGWRIESSTPMGEVQLAEPLAGKLVAVVRVYEERRAEFVALVLGPRGAQSEFSVDAADWAETAPLAHFRLVDGSLYRLGSTPAGVFVDRYDLGVS